MPFFRGGFVLRVHSDKNEVSFIERVSIHQGWPYEGLHCKQVSPFFLLSIKHC